MSESQVDGADGKRGWRAAGERTPAAGGAAAPDVGGSVARTDDMLDQDPVRTMPGTDPQAHPSATAAACRRSLRFGDLAEVMADLRALLPAHRTVGSWTLAQICSHLAQGFDGSITGFDLKNHRIKRLLFRRLMLRRALTSGIPVGYTVDPRLTPPEDVELEPAVRALDAAIQRYTAHRGRLQAHPLFGRMPRAVWDRVHCVHCAHHLSFAVPWIQT